jgi:putative IMPACT (imprinted ancient) family translation regulator
MVDTRLVMPYAMIEEVRRILASFGGAVVSEQFEHNVTLGVNVPEDRIADIDRALADATHGAVRLRQ